MKIVLTVVGMLVAVVLLQEAARIAFLYKKARDIDKNPILFSQKGDMKFAILIVGDRSVFASGYESPFDSLPGILATKLGSGSISVDGTPEMRIKDLASRLSSKGGTAWDLIIISVGENDVLHKLEAEEVEDELREGIEVARDLSNGSVIIVAPRDIGRAPIMPPVLPSQYEKLTKEYSNMYSNLAAEFDTEYIHSSYVGEVTNAISRDQYYLSDQFHVSKDGNRVWADGIIANSKYLLPYLK